MDRLRQFATPTAILVGSVLIAMALLFGGRYQTIDSGFPPIVWRLDRFTGEVAACDWRSGRCVNLSPPPRQRSFTFEEATKGNPFMEP